MHTKAASGMAQEYQLVDPFVSLPEPPQGEHRQLDPNIARWFRHSKALLAGATVDDMIADKDEAGIESVVSRDRRAPAKAYQFLPHHFRLGA